MVAVDLALALLFVPVLACAAYLFLLAVLASRGAPPTYGPPTKRFDFVVPAHDEEAGIAETVASLRAVDYPEALRRVLVVADNCTDRTAEVAQAAGATVLVRVNKELRGKGYALAHAFERSLADGFADAVVVVDADTTVSPNLLLAFQARIERGARAMQAEYGVRNPNAGWRTRLMVIALALFHVLRSLGRERLGVSAGLRGNGMCFSRELLREIPHDAFSIVEDLEYGIRLGYAGHRVFYCAEAHVLGEMVSSEKASRSQRQRWEEGRFAMAKAHAPKLLSAALARGDKVLLDLAMDVLVPPLTYLVVAAVVGAGLAIARVALWPHAGLPWLAVAPWALSLALVAYYVLRGVWLAGLGVRGFVDLAWAPVYMIWKIGLKLRSPAKKDEWIRTAREGEKP